MINRQDNYMARVENGTYPFPPLEDLERITNACGSSLEELFYVAYDSYYDDKAILDQFKRFPTKSRGTLMNLLVLFYEQNIAIENNKGDKK